jgi:diguanylate cyclase (GGDEF)-like protein
LANAIEHKERCILAVDDDRVLLAKLRICLPQAGYRVIDAPSAEAALSLLPGHEPDLALIDISLPGMSGFDLACHLRRRTAVPFLFLSSHLEPALARQAAERGALAYLVKPPDVRHVIPAIEAALLRADEIRRLRKLMRHRLRQVQAHHAGEVASLERRLARAQAHVSESRARTQVLSRLVNEDGLTGLPNRNWFMQFLPLAIERAQARNGRLALLYLDLDGFKAVNDSHGHAAGDQLLQAAALRMRSVLKPGDHIVRLGGDEFIAVIEHVQCDTDAAHVAARLAEALRNPFELERCHCMIGVSAGIALYPRDGGDAEALLHAADLAMYGAKSAGKGRYQFYAPAMVSPS